MAKSIKQMEREIERLRAKKAKEEAIIEKKQKARQLRKEIKSLKPSKLRKIARTVKRGAKATGRGLEATARVTRKGVIATRRGLEATSREVRGIGEELGKLEPRGFEQPRPTKKKKKVREETSAERIARVIGGL